MTRKEEIKEMARITASHITSDKDMQVAFADTLRRGAEWADANPNKDNMATAYKAGEAATIDKACEWIAVDVGGWFDMPYDKEGFIQEFKKAMKSGCSEFPNNCEKGE